MKDWCRWERGTGWVGGAHRKGARGRWQDPRPSRCQNAASSKPGSQDTAWRARPLGAARASLHYSLPCSLTPPRPHSPRLPGPAGPVSTPGSATGCLRGVRGNAIRTEQLPARRRHHWLFTRGRGKASTDWLAAPGPRRNVTGQWCAGRSASGRTERFRWFGFEGQQELCL